MAAEALRKGQEEFHTRREIKLGDFYSLNDACHVVTPPYVEVINKPEYGSMTSRLMQGTVRSVFRKDRQHCIGAKGSFRAVYYILDGKHRDRTDIDHITVRLRYSNGVMDTVDYDIDLGRRVSIRTKMARKE
jgi:hypothetical protein